MPGPWPAWLVILGGVTLSSPSSAIDPGRAEGFLVAEGHSAQITQAFACLHGNPPKERGLARELRIVIADREIPQQALAGPDEHAVLGLARSRPLLGLLLTLDPDHPASLRATLLAPVTEPRPEPPPQPRPGMEGKFLHTLSLAPTRVGGDIVCPASGPMECVVHFSAPVFDCAYEGP
jgi:hypothetical protein